MTPLERLLPTSEVMSLDADGASRFVSDAAPGILFVPGDPQRPEVTDVAVVLRVLRKGFPGLRVAVANEGDERTMKEAFGLVAFPALLFVKDGVVVKVLTRMCSWAVYEGAARALTGIGAGEAS